VTKAAFASALILAWGTVAHAAPPPADDLPDPPAPGASGSPGPSPPSAAAPTSPAAGAPRAAPEPALDDRLLPMPPQATAAPTLPIDPSAVVTFGPAGPSPAGATTAFGGYGEAQLFLGDDREAKLRRFVLYLGHRFNDRVSAYAEAAVEDGARVGMQQAYLDVVVDPHFGVRAGLMLVPLGIINQLHEPPTYLTVDRPLTDQLIIPTTWRELGLGVFGEIGVGLRYQAAVLTGLDPTGFSAEAPLAGTPGNGRTVDVHDPAFAGRLEFAGVPGLVAGAGGYLGWARGGHPELAGVRVGVAEGDVRYHNYGLDVRAEYAHMFIVDSYRLNDYFGLTGSETIPARGRGFYVQAGYDVLRPLWPELGQELYVFGGYENVNPRSRMSPYNWNPSSISHIPDESPPNAPSDAKQFVRAGLCYRPHPQVALKVDVQLAVHTAGPTTVPVPPTAGAPGVLQPLAPDVAAQALEGTRVGVGAAFMF